VIGTSSPHRFTALDSVGSYVKCLRRRKRRYLRGLQGACVPYAKLPIVLVNAISVEHDHARKLAEGSASLVQTPQLQVFIGNLAPDVTSDAVEDVVKKFGELERVMKQGTLTSLRHLHCEICIC
jgi:hypothetical protein